MTLLHQHNLITQCHLSVNEEQAETWKEAVLVLVKVTSHNSHIKTAEEEEDDPQSEHAATRTRLERNFRCTHLLSLLGRNAKLRTGLLVYCEASSQCSEYFV